MGGLYTVQDILANIRKGEFQSFVEGDTWAVTQVSDFPQKRVLDIVAVVGNLDEARILYHQVLAFAEDHGVKLVRADGREGWGPDAELHGWRKAGIVYYKDL
jgi:hypothetical protein